MSHLIRRFPVRSTLPIQPILTSSFHSSRARLAFSESDRDSHKDTPSRDAIIDQHKSDTVSKAKQGKGEWKPELASNSEQAVKADEHDISMKEMQDKGAKKAEQGKQPSGS